MVITSTRKRAVPAWVPLVLAAQLLVPTAALVAGDLPNRFGFQMYSAQGFDIAITATDSGGEEFEVPMSLVGDIRPEIDWKKVLPDHVCDRVDRASTVTVRQAGAERTVRCPR